MLLVVDGNSTMFAHQHGGNTLKAGDRETTAIFGTLNTLRQLQNRFPKGRLLVLWDHSPSWRAKEYPEYKANRDKNPQMIKVKDAVKCQQPILRNGLSMMGIRQMHAPEMEADDLAAWVAAVSDRSQVETKLITADRDWIQLVADHVAWIDPIHDRTVYPDTFFEDTGFRTPDEFVEAKIISGDSGDNVPGLGGLGEGAAKIIIDTFGNVATMRAEWSEFEPTIKKGDPWVRYRKKVQAFLDLGDEGQRRYDFGKKMMRLDPARVDPAAVVRHREIDHVAFRKWLGENAFGSITARFDDWIKPFHL